MNRRGRRVFHGLMMNRWCTQTVRSLVLKMTTNMSGVLRTEANSLRCCDRRSPAASADVYERVFASPLKVPSQSPECGAGLLFTSTPRSFRLGFIALLASPLGAA